VPLPDSRVKLITSLLLGLHLRARKVCGCSISADYGLQDTMLQLTLVTK
jgi:hypothetical protein